MGGLGSGLQLDPTKANYNADPTVTYRDRLRQQQLRTSSFDRLRKSGYKTAVDEQGKQYDFRAKTLEAMKQTPDAFAAASQWSDDEWRDYAENTFIAGQGGSPLAPAENKKPPGADLTDEFLQKARTNMALRLQSTRGRSSTFSQGSMGKLDLSKPVLGGY